jgi:hypothetical protein
LPPQKTTAKNQRFLKKIQKVTFYTPQRLRFYVVKITTKPHLLRKQKQNKVLFYKINKQTLINKSIDT